MIKNKNIILRVSEEFRELLEQKARKVGIPSKIGNEFRDRQSCI